MKDYSAAFVNTNGVAFPGTAGKNATGPSATDGTEFIKEFIDDLWGFNQALMSEAGLTPDGNAEVYNASQRMESLKTLFWPENHINGLVCSNGVDADHDFDISVGRAMDSSNTYLLRLDSVLTKQIDASWAEGTNVGGLFLGTVAANTLYHVFLIRKDVDGTIDGGFDTSATAANIPAGYTAYRRIFSFYTDASANIWRLKNVEIAGGSVETEFLFTASSPELNGAATATARNTLTSIAPPSTLAKIVIRLDYSTAGCSAWVRSTDFIDAAVSAANVDVIVSTSGRNCTAVKHVALDSSSLLAYRSSAVGGVLYINTIGYTDRRVS